MEIYLCIFIFCYLYWNQAKFSRTSSIFIENFNIVITCCYFYTPWKILACNKKRTNKK